MHEGGEEPVLVDGEVITGIVDDAQVVDAAQVIDGEVVPGVAPIGIIDVDVDVPTDVPRDRESQPAVEPPLAQQQEALGGEEALDESEIANCIINCKWRRASAPSVCGGACTRARARSVCACSDVGVNLLARPQTFRPT